MRVFLVPLLFAILAVAASAPSQLGTCAMYGSCGKRTVFGASVPCANTTAAVVPDSETLLLLTRICGADFPAENGVCCSLDQLKTLELNLGKAAPLVSSCPACRKNFFDFFCKLTCSPNQATFLDVVRTSQAVDTGKTVVAEANVYTDAEYAAGFFESCRNIKFAATNGRAMDLIGGGATTPEAFLKFLGDEKPLLGGLPFQINFVFEQAGQNGQNGQREAEMSQIEQSQREGQTGLPGQSGHAVQPGQTGYTGQAGLSGRPGQTGYTVQADLNGQPGQKGLLTGHPKSCADPDYKCACSDCPSLCPTLPKLKDVRQHCTVGSLRCFLFGVVMAWAAVVVAMGIFHMRLRARRIKAQNSPPVVAEVETPEPEAPLSRLGSAHLAALAYIEDLFEAVARACASKPARTILSALVAVAVCCSGLTQLQWETKPVNLWVSSDEPALHNLQYFEENFGEWFRIQQVIVSRKDGKPVLDWDTVQWWFAKEQQLYDVPGDGFFSMQPYCFKPMGETCATQSFTQYFDGDIGALTKETWKSSIDKCADSPVNCLPLFQQPLKKNVLFSDDVASQSRAFVVTLLFNSDLRDDVYTDDVVSYENALQAWVRGLQHERPDLNIDFSTESSLEQELNKSSNTDVKIVVLLYVVMFFYASLALGGRVPTSLQLKAFVHTRFTLGLAAIVTIILAVAVSAGVCAAFGIRSTLIIAEVIPFLVLAVGVDNVFLIVHELNEVSKNSGEPVVERIAKTMARIGPSCFTSFVLQTLMFLLAVTVKMPAVRNFAIYSAGAVIINFVLQMTLLVAILALDQRRMENSRVDFLPWLQADGAIELDSDGAPVSFEYNFHLKLEQFAPWLLERSRKRKIMTVFFVWLGISLSAIPYIELGLDQNLALPLDSYLIPYFDAVSTYLNVGPPMFLVVKDLNVTAREGQQTLCGKFSTCHEFSVANILEQEYKRGNLLTIAEPATNWLDDFLGWLNPDLDQCCRFRKGTHDFCPVFAPPRQCELCYADRDVPYNILMEGLPTGAEFMAFFKQWITEPSDPCPLGGKAPYGNSVKYTADTITSSYLRTSHQPLRLQADLIAAYENGQRIAAETGLGDSVFAHSPFYVFFVQYKHIIRQTAVTLLLAGAIIFVVSTLLLRRLKTAVVLTATVGMVLANILGVMAMWGILLNAVSLVNLVICLGLAVEFTVHVARAHVYSTKATDTERLADALCAVGSSVVAGITITKLIGIFVLAFTQLQIFEVYYFRMWLSLVVIAATHGLVLLPILLS